MFFCIFERNGQVSSLYYTSFFGLMEGFFAEDLCACYTFLL